MAFKRIWHQPEVLPALDAGATLVTSGERLARAVRLAHGEARLAAGARAWERPQVLSYGAFLNRMYDEAAAASLGAQQAPPPMRLTQPAAEALWEEAVRASTVGLLQPAAAAREAHAAWELSVAYRLPLERIAISGDLDAQQFAAWAAHLRIRSRELGALEDARLTDWLATQLREGRLAAPAEAWFLGFDELTPQQRELLECLRVRGSRVQLLEMAAPPAPAARRTVCDDAEAEMRAAASWSRALLERDPAARIGIVVRDLASCRAALARALDDALCPTASAGTQVTKAYDLSLGLPLASFPAVHAAFAVLELLRRRLPFKTASLLLRTPFLAAAEGERDGRARLELKLRERLSETLAPRELTAFAAGTAGCARLAAALRALVEINAAQPARQIPSAWGELFRRALAESGWPGERALDSREYQAVTAFRELLGSLTQLDAALGAVNLGDALGRLRRLAEDSIFQPAAEDAPVQVVGLLETAGLSFDHLWLMGMSDDAWPASPRPGAYIPLALQREHGLPHASAALELKFAQRITERLLASAAEVVVSTPGAEGDEELRPSPLITHLATIAVEALPQTGSTAYRESLRREYGKAAEAYTDMRGPALRPGEQAAGGTGLIRSQAACPFQAFGRYRLGAAALEEPALGPDAAERGLLVHEVLQAVWAELKDQAALAALDTGARRGLVERSVAAALAARHRSLPEVYTQRVTELEQQRLTGLIGAWLELDAARPPFRVVEREAWHEVQLGPLK
ncbi:MAG TPA: PD-(D/E)XK nuclease family protein, partial [Gammaproteobacteria bacterium]|nr:PD-(D/E)XK nuclease family protein [Gammaproteobacteria bacterium]